MSPAPQPVTLALASGLTLHGLRWPADAAGEPALRALALHGWLDNAASFEPLAPALAARGVEVVAIDLPGHGLSDHKPAAARYHFIDAVADAVDTLDALGWARAALIGHSMGAAIASLTAGLSPDRVSHLVMLDGIGPLTTEPEDALASARQHVQEAGTVRPPPTFPDLDTLAARRAQAFGGVISHAGALRLVTRGSLPTPEGGWRQRHDPRLRLTSLLRLTEAHVAAFFGAVTAPTLVVRAQGGWPAPEDLIRARLSYFTGAPLKLVEVPGGHHAHLDDPAPLLPHLFAHLLGAPPTSA